MRTQSIDKSYRDLLSDIHHHGTAETNSRTGVDIKMLRGAYSFKVSLKQLPVPGNRRYWPRIAAAETAWQILGTKDPAFILKHAPKLWSKFVEEGELKTAYGYRWREHFGRDQFAMAISALDEDPTNRQIFISAWDPGADGLGAPNLPKNIPCPTAFSLTRTAGELHCSMFLRSSDVMVGLPYDVMNYALLTDAVAASLGCKPGTLHVTMAHPHIYEPHWHDVEECLNGSQKDWMFGVQPDMPGWSTEEIEDDPEGYVARVSKLASDVFFNPWNPCPELIE